MVYADTELIYHDDISDVRKFRIGEGEIKRITINLLAYTGS
jgi:hypothetical protein